MDKVSVKGDESKIPNGDDGNEDETTDGLLNGCGATIDFNVGIIGLTLLLGASWILLKRKNRANGRDL